MSRLRRASRSRQAGLSLIELMIALLIGLLLLLGVVQVFSASSNAYRLAKAQARLQEGGRFAMDYLSRDLRMAGHMGCSSDTILTRDGSSLLTTRTTFGAGADAALQFNFAVRGYGANGTTPGTTVTLSSTPTVGGSFTPALPAQIAAALTNRVAGSDILVLRYLEGQGLPIATAVNGATPTFAISPSAADWTLFKGGIAAPGLFGITTCDNAIVFQAAAVSPAASVSVGATALNAGLANVNFKFPQGAELYRAESEVYYVGLNSQTQRPSLYRVRFTAAPGGALTTQSEELVEGVENMQLLYGQDQAAGTTPSGAVTQLLTAAQVDASMGDPEKAWRRVVSVQIGLVMASPEPASAAQATADNRLTTQGVTFITPDDARARSVYQSTVTLRNRLYGN